jgi:class 3 adenylate cyclase
MSTLPFGREVSTAGDGFLATFDGPARAIRCAGAIAEAVAPLGLEVRAGLHTGEIELMGDDVAGLAVHIAARVAASAGPGEILASSTVKDLVAGSGIRFADRGAHTLKGVPNEWRLFAVVQH